MIYEAVTSTKTSTHRRIQRQPDRQQLFLARTLAKKAITSGHTGSALTTRVQGRTVQDLVNTSYISSTASNHTSTSATPTALPSTSISSNDTAAVLDRNPPPPASLSSKKYDRLDSVPPPTKRRKVSGDRSNVRGSSLSTNSTSTPSFPNLTTPSISLHSNPSASGHSPSSIYTTPSFSNLSGTNTVDGRTPQQKRWREVEQVIISDSEESDTY